LRVIKSAPRALPNLAEVQSFAAIPGVNTAGRLIGDLQRALGRDTVVGRLDLTPPRTPFNGRVSAHRRYAFGRLSLEDVKNIKTHYGCTVNDVVVAICAGAVRRWLVEH